MKEDSPEVVDERDSFAELWFARFDDIDARFDSLEARLIKLDTIYAEDTRLQKELLTEILNSRIH